MAEVRISEMTAHSTGVLAATDLIEVSEDLGGGLFASRKLTGAELGASTENFANTDLTVTGTRAHDLDGNTVGFLAGNTIFQNNVGETGVVVSIVGEEDTTLEITQNDGSKLALDIGNGLFRIAALPIYANDAAAGVGGLTTGYVYQTATGELRIKL